MGGISKCGDALMRETLFEAALVLMTHSRKWSWLKAWGMKIARHRGMKRAIVAVARRLAAIARRGPIGPFARHSKRTELGLAQAQSLPAGNCSYPPHHQPRPPHPTNAIPDPPPTQTPPRPPHPS